MINKKIIPRTEKVILQDIKDKFDFLVYKQGVDSTKYHKVYTNSNGAMYYLIGDSDNIADPTAVLIENRFKVYYTAPWIETVKGISSTDMLRVINKEREIISPEAFLFDNIHLNADNSFLFTHRGISGNFEYNAKLQKEPRSSFKKPINVPRNISQLPNGLTVQFGENTPYIRTIRNAAGKEILTHIEYIQKLSENCLVIWQKIPNINDDLYIIDLNVRPDNYEKAFTKVGIHEANQELVDGYKKRYLNVVNILLDKQNHK